MAIMPELYHETGTILANNLPHDTLIILGIQHVTRNKHPRAGQPERQQRAAVATIMKQTLLTVRPTAADHSADKSPKKPAM